MVRVRRVARSIISTFSPRLRRSGLERYVSGQHAGDIVAITRTLGATDLATPMFVDDREVPRAGAQVSLRDQRARFRGGRTVVWLGYDRRVGRGEGTAAVRFDQLLASAMAED